MKLLIFVALNSISQVVFYLFSDWIVAELSISKFSGKVLLHSHIKSSPHSLREIDPTWWVGLTL